MPSDFDLIVIGGGGGGMSAALMAAGVGARTLLLEASERCGGATALSGGAFYAANTRVQQANGIQDSAEAMYVYGMALNRYRMEPSVFRRFCEDGAQALHWLMDLGVQFPAAGLTLADVSGVARAHWAVGRGAAIAEVLEGHLSGAGVEVATHSRVSRLLVEDGRVVGVEADGQAVRAKAVVIASGGFGANADLLARYYPASQVEGWWYIGPPSAQGDALALGANVGALLYGEDRGLQLMSPGLHRTLEMPPGWLVLVNSLGRRFMNEAVPYCVHNSAFEGQPDRTGFAIFDAAAFAAPPTDPRWGSPEGGTDWRHEILAEGVRAGRIAKGDTLEALGEAAGIHGPALAETIARYNADAAAGVDTQFFKDAMHLRPLGEGPYYAARMTMQILCFTSFGLKIDAEARVQDHAGRAIPGLYAAGEAAAGAQGEVYLGSGSSIGNAVTFGRIAGLNAGRQALSNSGEI